MEYATAHVLEDDGQPFEISYRVADPATIGVPYVTLIVGPFAISIRDAGTLDRLSNAAHNAYNDLADALAVESESGA